MPKKKVSEVNKEAEEALHAKKAEFWGKIIELENEYNLKVVAMIEYRAQGILPVIGLGEKKKNGDS